MTPEQRFVKWWTELEEVPSDLSDVAGEAFLAGYAQGQAAPRYRSKDGRLIHDGDCRFWSKHICTCGLLHWLAPQIPKEDWFYQETAQQDAALQEPS